MIAVAQVFEQSGDPSLIALLTGEVADNPIIGWRRDLEAAQSLIDSDRAAQAVELLHAALAKTSMLRGSAVDTYRPRTYGMLGVAYFHTGDHLKAVEFTREAKVRCEELGDEDGVATYSGNLEHIRQFACSKSRLFSSNV
jgi:hypothetical protein